MDELDFERIGIITESYDYYNDHKSLSLDDIDYERFEEDYGREQLTEDELNSI